MDSWDREEMVMQNFHKLDGLQTVAIIQPKDLQDYEKGLKVLKKTNNRKIRETLVPVSCHPSLDLHNYVNWVAYGIL
jgi:hypothetical protein